MPRSENRADRGTHRGALALALAAAGLLLAAGSASAAPPNWMDPVDLSTPGRNASDPKVAMDAAGNTTAMWERELVTQAGLGVQSASRGLGENFALAFDSYLAQGDDPQIAMTPSGEAVTIWRRLRNPPGVYVIEAATKPPGGSFGAPVTVYEGPPSPLPQNIHVAIGPGGDIAVTWTIYDPESGFDDLVCETKVEGEKEVDINCPNPFFVMASVRPAGGAFTPPERVSPEWGPKEHPEESETEKEEREEREKAESKMTARGAIPAVDAAGNVTVGWIYHDSEEDVIQRATRPAGGSFSSPETISDPGEDAGNLGLAADAAGNTTAVWTGDAGARRATKAATMPPGGAFGAPETLSSLEADAGTPQLAVSPGGFTGVSWWLDRTEEATVQAAFRAPGGSFSAPLDASSGTDDPLFPELAVSDQGDAIVTWSGDNSTSQIARAAVRPAGSPGFGPPVAISKISGDPFHPMPAMNSTGDATVLWVRFSGAFRIVQMAGYDADPPVLAGVSVPASGEVGQPLAFSAVGGDVWPVGAPMFDFGDGSGATGFAVGHAFATPGPHTVVISVTDAGGRTTATARTVLVTARNAFTIGKFTRNRKKGTGALSISVPEPGTLTLKGRFVKRVRKRVSPGTARLPVRAVGKGKKRLKRKGKLKLKLRIVYDPVGGVARTKRRTVVLRKQQRHARKSKKHGRRARHG